MFAEVIAILRFRFINSPIMYDVQLLRKVTSNNLILFFMINCRMRVYFMYRC